jgi:hypothetical protein
LAQQKFGGDSVLEMQRNFDGYIEQIRSVLAGDSIRGTLMQEVGDGRA